MNKKVKNLLVGTVLTLGTFAVLTSIYAESASSSNAELLSETFGTSSITRSTQEHRHGIYKHRFDQPTAITNLILRDFEMVGFEILDGSLSMYLKYTPLRFSLNSNSSLNDERIRIRTLLNRGDINQNQHDYLISLLNYSERILPPSHLVYRKNDVISEHEEEQEMIELEEEYK